MSTTVERSTEGVVPPFDPYELQDTVAGNIRDPFPRMHELCRQSPVHVGPLDIGAGPEQYEDTPANSVTVLGYDEASAVLRDNETYSSRIYEGVMGAVMGRTILEMDEPEHRMHRALVAPAFRSKMLERWESGLVGAVVDELIDEFIDDGRADLVRRITFNFPVQVIARILGLPRRDYPKFQRWAIEITSVVTNWDRGIKASNDLRDYFAEIMELRRHEPDDDLISDLCAIEVDGRRLTDEEIFSFLRLLLPAGVETTYRASGSMLFGLLTRPDQLAAVEADRSLIPQAIEETVRWEPPVTVILRRATREAELAGVRVEEGADVALLLGAANRDERRFEDPDEFDIFRKSRQHVGFGFGVHVCLGMHLARMETRVAVNRLLDRLADLRLDPGPDDDPHIAGLAFRSPVSLPVSFRPR
jgi:cytochrome P450